MTKINWRLKSLPTTQELRDLVKDKIISQEEARDILFKDSDEPKTEDLKDEIKFLRTLVEKLSENRPDRLATYVYSYPSGGLWYQPYYNWCSAGSSGTSTATLAYSTGAGSTSMYVGSANSALAAMPDTAPAAGINFSEIKTF